MSSFEATLQTLPKPILSKLRSIIRRVRNLIWVRGIFATLAIGLLCLLAIMAIDASVLIVSTWVRWALTISGVVFTLLSGWWFLIRPLSRKLSLTHVARILEIRHPELQERISTAVELLDSDDPEEIKGSRELINAVVDAAVVDVKEVDPRREFKGARAAKFVGLAVGSSALLLAVLLAFPHQGKSLLVRALMPYRNVGNAYSDSLVVKPGDFRVAQGQALKIEVSSSRSDLSRVELRRVLPDGTESVERMPSLGLAEDGTQQFAIIFPNIQTSFRYRVLASSAISEYFWIKVVPPPKIDRATIRYEFPVYTGLEAVVDKDPEFIEFNALAHTGVTFSSQFNNPIASAQTILNEKVEIGETYIESDRRVVSNFNLRPSMNGVLRIRAVDKDQFQNQPQSYPIRTTKDQPPSVSITNPSGRELWLKPVELLPISYQISEDYGVAEVVLLVVIDGESEARVIDVPLPESVKEGLWQGVATLNLAEFGFTKTQNRLEVQLRVSDNLPEAFGGPGQEQSETIVIMVDNAANSLAVQTIDAQKRELEKTLRDARNDLTRAQSDLDKAEQEISSHDEFSSNAEHDLDRFRVEAKEAKARLQAIANNLDNSIFDRQAKALRKIAKQSIVSAQEKVDLIVISDEKHRRQQYVNEANREIDQALSELREVEDSIRDMQPEQDAIKGINQLANQQRQLSRDASLIGDKKADLSKFQQQQERLQKDLSEMVKRDPDTLKELLGQQQENAKQIAEQAEQLAQKLENFRRLNSNAAASNQSPQQKADLQRDLMQQLEQQEAPDKQKKAVEAGDLQRALSMMEEQLSNEAEALAESAESQENALANLEQRKSRNEPNAASNLLRNAASQSKNAARHFERAQRAQTDAESQGQVAPGELDKKAKQSMRQAQTHQKSAQRSMATAAHNFTQSAQQIEEALQELQSGLSQEQPSNQLVDSQKMAESFQKMSNSTRSKNPREAVERSEQAARAMQELAQQAMQKLGQLGQPPQSSSRPQSSQPSDDSLRANQAGGKRPDISSQANLPPELEALGLSESDWERFKGTLNGGSSASNYSQFPSEYRDLVGRYFEAIGSQAQDE